MESNREESEKCIAIAKKLISEQNYSKARKFLLKSIKLYPTSKAKGILELTGIDVE